MAPKDPGSGVCWMSWSVFPSKQDSIDASRSNDPYSNQATRRSEKISLREKIRLTWTFFQSRTGGHRPSSPPIGNIPKKSKSSQSFSINNQRLEEREGKKFRINRCWREKKRVLWYPSSEEAFISEPDTSETSKMGKFGWICRKSSAFARTNVSEREISGDKVRAELQLGRQGKLFLCFTLVGGWGGGVAG